MPAYDPNPQIIQLSLQELEKIVTWINRRNRRRENPTSPTTVLIGGWAVDAFNPYLGSVDIDLVTNSRTKISLMHHLQTNEGYIYDTLFPFGRTVFKQTLHGPIILDFGKRGTQYKFEGHPEIPFTLDILSENTIIKSIRGRTEMAVPTRSVLVLLKLKAAWDRTHRLENGRSVDEQWERGKMVKDCSDILALIDPEHGQREIDLEVLGQQISRVGFLKDFILHIPEIDAARVRYERMSSHTIRTVCEDFVSIL